MNKNNTFEEFLKIIETLRGENGCPWDREQTHTSLKPCVMEEAAELVCAIRIYDQTGNSENMQEELGDLLLQVVMHSQIAQEEGLFTIEDVINTVSEKMIRRHPHVFGSVHAENSDQVLNNWEEIKKAEKEGDGSAYNKAEQLLEEKMSASQDGTIYLNDADMKTIIEATKEEDAGKTTIKDQPQVGANLDLQI